MSHDITRRRLLASGALLTAGAGVGARRTVRAASPSRLDEPELRWSRVYGSQTQNGVSSVVETDDAYVAVGGRGDGSGGQSGWLFGVDATSGEGRWQATVENPDLDTQPQLQDLAATNDGDDDGFVLLGGDVLSGDASVVRTTPDGEVVWWETYEPTLPDGADEDADPSFFPLADGNGVVADGDGYVVTLVRVVDRSFDTVVMKVDGDGVEQWRHQLFTDQLSLTTALTPVGDGEYVGAGIIQDPPDPDSSEQPPARGNVFRLAADGTLDWQRSHRAPSGDGGEAQNSQYLGLVETVDGYAVAGTAVASQGDSPDGWLRLLDEEGNPVAESLVSPAEATQFSAVTAAEGTVTVVGEVAESRRADTNTAWVGEFDADAGLQWNKTPQESDVNQLTAVTHTEDGGLLAAGSARTEDPEADPQSQAWLTKFGGAAFQQSTETPAPTATETPAETTAPAPTTPTPTETATPTPTATETPTSAAETTSGDGPGFGVGAALAALGAGALLRRVGLGRDEE